MDDLDKLLAEYRAARLKYPNVRREVEDRLLEAIITRIKAQPDLTELNERLATVEDEIIRRRGGRPKAEAA